jgi:hypothetical protein
MVSFGEVIRVFVRRTSQTPGDLLAFVGDPPLFLPSAEEVRVCCVFTWDVDAADRLARSWSVHYRRVSVGGPGVGDRGGEFVPGLFVKRGVTFTSDGCPNRCAFCLVRHPLRVHPVVQPGNLLQDDNFLACPRPHRVKVYAMLRGQHRIVLSGGLDAERLEDWDIEELRGLNLQQLFLAFDSEDRARGVSSAIQRLVRAGFPAWLLRCYVLAGYTAGDTPARASERCKLVYDWGALPFGMVYVGPDGRRPSAGSPWSLWARTWTRPALIKRALSV